MVHKISKRKLNEWIKDEKRAVKDYQNHGLYNLARDEFEHLKYFKKLKTLLK